MTPSSTHLVLIPSYNPGARVFSTVQAALDQWAPVWVVVDGSTDNLIEAEVQGLREQMLVLSRSDFIELIEQRSQDQDVRGAVYLMVDPQLRPVAGNVPPWPKIDAGAGKYGRASASVAT